MVAWSRDEQGRSQSLYSAAIMMEMVMMIMIVMAVMMIKIEADDEDETRGQASAPKEAKRSSRMSHAVMWRQHLGQEVLNHLARNVVDTSPAVFVSHLSCPPL